ncbi:hypothetical protein F4556_005761 [Kitasatospora gansuensis]|uniref:Peptidase inhibitor family I36 n=1 Tax=Kitasatospora gansuensis TaxID=258050 RepID=A0A7W7SGV0_9ACTN|nr:hypothetical protein [Kitasatospora gansuensis]MBB4950226.1 hypothetical protein [Kitasatospora gansuensis]
MKKAAVLAATAGLLGTGLMTAAPANAQPWANLIVEACDTSHSGAGDLCLFYNSGYQGSNIGFWGGDVPNLGAYRFITSGNGQGQGVWHNGGSDANYNTIHGAWIIGAGGNNTWVAPNTSNNLGGNSKNLQEQVVWG